MNSQDCDIVASGEVNMDELSKKKKKAQWQRNWRKKNKEKIKAINLKYRKDNYEKVRAREKTYYSNHKKESKAYREKNREVIKIRELRYRKDNLPDVLLKEQAYREKNREVIRLRNKKYTRERCRNDVQFKLSRQIRTRVGNCAKRQKNSSAIKELGCTLKELKLYLEAQFQPGMSWDNHGLRGWHIDHIKPLASFDLTDPEQFKQACHYSNLQPLWATDNLSKGAKIIDKKQSLEHTANTNQSTQTEDIGITYIQAPKDPNGVEMNDC